MSKLTAKETAGLTSIMIAVLPESGKSKPEELLEDNFSWFTLKDVMSSSGFSHHEASGVLSALDKKGMVEDDESNDEPDRASWSVTEDGIREMMKVMK